MSWMTHEKFMVFGLFLSEMMICQLGSCKTNCSQNSLSGKPDVFHWKHISAIMVDQAWSRLINIGQQWIILAQTVGRDKSFDCSQKWSVMKRHDQSWNVMINHYLREVFSVYTDISLHCLRTARFNLRTLHSSGKELFLCYLSLEKSLGESSGVIGPKENKLDPSGGLSVFAKCQAKLHFAIWKTNFPSLSIQ